MNTVVGLFRHEDDDDFAGKSNQNDLSESIVCKRQKTFNLCYA